VVLHCLQHWCLFIFDDTFWVTDLKCALFTAYSEEVQVLLRCEGNVNIAALVTIVQCNTLVLCSRQFLGPADWVFVTLALCNYAVISLEVVAYSSYCNTVESFSALTLLVGSPDL